MYGELVKFKFFELVIPNAWLMVATEPARSVSNRCAVVALLALKPGKPAALPSRLLIGNVVAAPNVANGVKPGSPNPLDIVLRNSMPPLNACRPCVQLTSSPMECIGLLCERHAPKRPY